MRAVAATARYKWYREQRPATIRFKGVNITPGGFIEAANGKTGSAPRGADSKSRHSLDSYSGQLYGKLSEMNLTARQSRLSLLFDSKVGDHETFRLTTKQTSSAPGRPPTTGRAIPTVSGSGSCAGARTLRTAGRFRRGRCGAWRRENKKGIENRRNGSLAD